MASTIPQHIGIIMDGNRRWARQQGLPTLEGHRRGYEKMKKVGDWCLERGVKILSVYALSTENMKRTKREVSYLLRLLRDALEKDVREFHRKGVQLLVSGRVDGLPNNLRRAITNAVDLTKHNTRGILNICLNYGGRSELVDAVKKIVSQRLTPTQVTESVIADNLYVPGLPDPDLIIRTSEKRISNFLTWQSVYSEIFFVEKHWPAFTEKDLDAVLGEYQSRQRRFGK